MLDPVELFPEVPNLYEFPSVHADMVYDERRVTAYKRAIDSTVKKGDVVVDVGAGTGLLSFLCLQAGAARVHAIERSPVVEWAKQLAEKNGFADRIVFHHADARSVDVGEKADVIVSELIGHVAFEEGMAETISDAKKRFLKPDGILIPGKVTLNAAPVHETDVYPAYVDGWRDAWGIDYSVMREKATKGCYIIDLSERQLMAQHQPVCSIDFLRNGSLQMQSEQTFKVYRSGEVNGVAFWFDADLSANERLSSGPWTKTHWRQCFAPLSRPVSVRNGQSMQLVINMQFRTKKNDRFVFSMQLEKVG